MSAVRLVSFHRLVILTAAVMLLSVVGGPSGVVVGGEDRDPYAADPLGLVAHYDLTTQLGTTADVFEVWFCHVSGGPYGLSQVPVEAFAPVLARSVGGYWSHASGGLYEAEFVVGGNIRDPAGGCRAGVREQSAGGSQAALIVEFNSHFPVGGAGTGTAGRWCSDGRSTWWCEDTYPDNGRDALVQAGGGPQAVPLPSAVVHEMGHTLGVFSFFYGFATRQLWSSRVRQSDGHHERWGFHSLFGGNDRGQSVRGGLDPPRTSPPVCGRRCGHDPAEPGPAAF